MIIIGTALQKEIIVTQDAMRFVGPTGDTFALLHVVPLRGELLYSADGTTFRPLEFISKRGEHFTSHTHVEYQVWIDPTGEKSVIGGEPLVHHDSVVTYRGAEYRIDQDCRRLEECDILR